MTVKVLKYWKNVDLINSLLITQLNIQAKT